MVSLCFEVLYVNASASPTPSYIAAKQTRAKRAGRMEQCLDHMHAIRCLVYVVDCAFKIN